MSLLWHWPNFISTGPDKEPAGLKLKDPIFFQLERTPCVSDGAGNNTLHNNTGVVVVHTVYVIYIIFTLF